ncbi:RNA-binding transcriptional accessory protein [Fulvivirga sp. RKSG066]|uniref:Tex family protein n=1 Tax=Fulvivirga aurantia TaxID=2529383 RepID=UPI0012BC6A62|nr:Tex family protein [Fulvivirga aurantia]MTI21074.1 RNA-binding transcriptional accessory protein [Fulvivirga aurantia]
MSNILKVAKELNISEKQVKSVVELLDGGATVPFISRYRKEMTGSLDEVAITDIRDRVTQLRDLDKRREAILKSIDSQEKLTPELEKEINAAETLAELEDIYLPYKPKRKTKASVAREKGLEPLAKLIFEQSGVDVEAKAAEFINDEKGVENADAALQGARDIIAEWVNEDQEARKKIRELFEKEAQITSKVIKGKEEEGQKYKDYFEWDEPISKTPSHRLLAMRRGEKEMILSLDISPDDDRAVSILERQFVSSNDESAEQVKVAIADCYKRLLRPSMETEIRIVSKTKADEEAIRVFADNLRQLLLAAPLGQKNVLALDPGFRTGCKLVVLDKQGKLLHNEAIFPNEPQKQTTQSGHVVMAMCAKYNVEAIAIGNGTASRETEAFVKSLGLPKEIMIIMVNESGASVYSASEVARNEFPDYDVTVRGAVSIGRRLMDPLAELVKIDPKSIGVGQYQHDVDQSALKNGLDDVVMSCVNSVGVELNTASKELLSYVSGLGPSLAKSIVDFRNQNGPFKDRKALTNVPRLGDKAFEQAAGFLRIRKAENPLDASAVHPESYHIVTKMADDLGCTIQDLINDVSLRNKINLKNYVTEDVGMPTLQDIVEELAKPGRDPRETFEVFSFQEGVNHMEDLRVGMVLPGIVTNITNFGAFVDIGVHQDGLVHVSHLSDSFVKNPAEEVSVQQKVTVTVMEVDIKRKRIGLSMKSDPFGKEPQRKAPKKSQRKEKQPEGDFQSKLNELKGLFNK